MAGVEDELASLCEACPYTSLLPDTPEGNRLVSLDHPKQPGLSAQYSLIPDSEGMLVCSVGGDDVSLVTGGLDNVLRTIVNKWCTEVGVCVPDGYQLLGSQLSAVSSDYYTSEGDDDYDSYDAYEPEDVIHPLIETEIKRVQYLYGYNSIETRIHAGIDEMDIFFNIDLNNFMDEHMSMAWGVKLSEPLVILLHIRTVSKYLNGVEPVVDVFQAPPGSKLEKKKVAIGHQLKKIIENFVSIQWKKLSNESVERQMTSFGDQCDLTLPASMAQGSLGAQMKSPEDNPMAVKDLPGLELGFLAQCLQYGMNRITTLNEFCVICDERHIIETGLIKPCVCTRELCVFAFQTLGVMADAAEAIATDGDVVDLLIAMANAAANSARCKIIFDPFPSIVNPVNPNTLALDPKNQDFHLVRDVLKEVVTSREAMLAGRATGVKEELDTHHRLAFPLMQWIITTSRAHIVLLPEDRRLPSLNTKYQFLLISSPPGKEAAFQAAKTKTGSTFAFHGSSIENWHSIMRKGLINASGTKLQMHGAAYGKGIYLSPLSSVSFGYTGRQYMSSTDKQKPRVPGIPECLAGKVSLSCIALCEVVLSPDLHKSRDIWVCPNPDHVCTRFFFVFDSDPKSAGVVLDTRVDKFRKEIQHAVGHISMFRKSKAK